MPSDQIPNSSKKPATPQSHDNPDTPPPPKPKPYYNSLTPDDLIEAKAKLRPTSPGGTPLNIIPLPPIMLTQEDQDALMKAGQYRIGPPWLTGGFGIVYTATSGFKHEELSLMAKVIELKGLSPKYMDDLVKWKEFKYANVLPCKEVVSIVVALTNMSLPTCYIRCYSCMNLIALVSLWNLLIVIYMRWC